MASTTQGPTAPNVNAADVVAKLRAAPLTSSVLALSVVVSLIRVATATTDSDRVASELGLSPGGLMQVKLWTLVTAALVQDWFSLATTLPAFAACSLSLEREWGARRVAELYGLVSVAAAGVSLACVFAAYVATLRESFLFDHQFGAGALASAAAVGVVYAHVARGAEARVAGTDMDVRSAAIPALMAYAVLRAALGLPARDAVLAAVGFLVAVARLSGDAVGLGLDSFTPPAAAPVVRAALSRVAPRLVSSGSAAVSATAASLAMQQALHSVPDPVAERRRQRALKALDKKLAEMENEPQVDLEAGGSSLAQGGVVSASAPASAPPAASP